MTPPESNPQSVTTTLTDDARRVLVRVIQVAFPHPRFPDAPYERTAQRIIDAARESTWSWLQLTQGLRSLDDLASGSFVDADDEQAFALLRGIEQTDFFNLIRRLSVLNLYDDHEVWDLLGYEGPSFEKGGYLHRGFNDLDWLPEPRITEYDAEAEAAAKAGADAGTDTAGSAGQPGSTEQLGSPEQPPPERSPAATSRDAGNQPSAAETTMTEVTR